MYSRNDLNEEVMALLDAVVSSGVATIEQMTADELVKKGNSYVKMGGSIIRHGNILITLGHDRAASELAASAEADR